MTPYLYVMVATPTKMHHNRRGRKRWIKETIFLSLLQTLASLMEVSELTQRLETIMCYI